MHCLILGAQFHPSLPTAVSTELMSLCLAQTPRPRQSLVSSGSAPDLVSRSTGVSTRWRLPRLRNREDKLLRIAHRTVKPRCLPLELRRIGLRAGPGQQTVAGGRPACLVRGEHSITRGSSMQFSRSGVEHPQLWHVSLRVSWKSSFPAKCGSDISRNLVWRYVSSCPSRYLSGYRYSRARFPQMRTIH